MQFGSVNAIDTCVIIVMWEGSNNYSIYLMPILKKQAENIHNAALAPLMKMNAGLFYCPAIKTITLMCDFIKRLNRSDWQLEKQCAL